jgi:hypothetical protein
MPCVVLCRGASPLFCLLATFGAMMTVLYVFLGAQYHTEAICQSLVWVTFTGTSLFFSCILAKTYRLWRVFDNKQVRAPYIIHANAWGRWRWKGGMQEPLLN